MNERMQGYCKAVENGTEVDLNGMAEDLVMMAKFKGWSKEVFLEALGELYDDTVLEVHRKK